LEQRQQRLAKEILEQEERQTQLAQEKELLAERQRELAEECSQAEALVGELNAELEREKAGLIQLTDQMDEGKGDLVDLLGELARARNDQLSMRKRLEEFGRRQSRQESEYQELKEKHEHLQPQIESLEKKKSSIEKELKKLSGEVNSLKQQQQKLEQDREGHTETITALESTYHQQESQLKILLEMEESYAWFNDAVRELMNARDEKELHCNIQGAVAEMLEVDVSHRQAVEAVLGSRLQALVVDSVSDARTALQHLKRTRTGRNYFVPLSVTNEAPELKADGEGPVPLARLVRPHPGYESVINHLLSRVLFCSDLEQALSWWQLHPNAYILVTVEGDLIAQDGTLWGGSQEQQISILGKQEERKDLEAEITASEKRLKTERDKSRKVDEQLTQIVSRLQSIQENQQILRDQLLEQEKAYYRLQAEHQGIIERLAVLENSKGNQHVRFPLGRIAWYGPTAC
jgi:chromosome segregation protein